MYKNVNTVSDEFFAQKYASHATAVVIDDIIIIGRRRIYYASTLLGRFLCKRVDVCIITLSCTWRICALSERLLVSTVANLLKFNFSYQFCHLGQMLLHSPP